MSEERDRGVIEPEVREFVRKVKQVFNAKVIFFGSRIRGDYLETSDYDFIIISDAFKGIPFIKRMFIVAELAGDLPVEAFCYTQEEFNKKKEQLGFVTEAVKEGVEL